MVSRRIRKSKRRLRQKQRQKQIIKIHMPVNITSTSGGGGGVPAQWYIPGKPIVGDTHLPNHAAINPNVEVPEPRGVVEEPAFHIIPPRQRAKPSTVVRRSAPAVQKAAGEAPPMPQPPVAGVPPGEQGTPAASPPQEGGEHETTPPKTPAVSRRVEFVPSPETGEYTAVGGESVASGPPAAGGASLSEASPPKSGGGFFGLGRSRKISPGIPVSLGTRNIATRRGSVFG